MYLTDGERGRDADKCCVNSISGEILRYWRVFSERRRRRVQTFHVMLIYSRPVIRRRVDALISEEAVSDGAFLPHQQPDVRRSLPLNGPRAPKCNVRDPKLGIAHKRLHKDGRVHRNRCLIALTLQGESFVASVNTFHRFPQQNNQLINERSEATGIIVTWKNSSKGEEQVGMHGRVN